MAILPTIGNLDIVARHRENTADWQYCHSTDTFVDKCIYRYGPSELRLWSDRKQNDNMTI